MAQAGRTARMVTGRTVSEGMAREYQCPEAQTRVSVWTACGLMHAGLDVLRRRSAQGAVIVSCTDGSLRRA